MNKAVLIIVFSRPDKFRKVLEPLKIVKPPRLYIAADGPRKNNKNDKIRCKETRDIVKEIGWECDVKTLFRDNNLGCEKAVSSSITWFFENEEDGIILEDDIIGDISFFSYCEKLLDYYKNDEKIMHIGNNNVHNNNSLDSYYFCSIGNSWGWASWKRAWKYFDLELSKYSYEEIRNSINNIFDDEIFRRFWINCGFNMKTNTKKAVWDMSWIICMMINDGLSVYPNQNLIKNIGFDDSATHCTSSDNRYSNLETQPLKELKYLNEIYRNKYMDSKIMIEFYGQKPFNIKDVLNDLDRLNFIINETINKIVWFIPIKSIRNKVRNHMKNKLKSVKPHNYPIDL